MPLKITLNDLDVNCVYFIFSRIGWMTNADVSPATEGGPAPCQKLPGLSAGQNRLCQLYGDHMVAVAMGARQAVKECQHQFKHRRWNCSVVDDVSVFGPVSKIGT